MSAPPIDPLVRWTRRRRLIAIGGLTGIGLTAAISALPLISEGTQTRLSRDSARLAVSAASNLIQGTAEPGASAAADSVSRHRSADMDLQAFALNLWRVPARVAEPEPTRATPIPRLQPPAITLIALLDVESQSPRVAVTIPSSPRVRLLSIGDSIAESTIVGIDGDGIDVEHHDQPFRLDLPRRPRSWPAALDRIVNR